jgi:hypothetical protein
MKNGKFGFRAYIAAGSVIGFLGGWALLAHSPKPAPMVSQAGPAATVEPLPTLAPLPPMGQLSAPSQSFRLAPSFSQTSAFRPRFRTGGS